MAALTRELDAGDAGRGAWLRADPVYVRADANGAHLQAWGSLGLAHDECAELVAALRPLFGDAGMALDAPAPGRWYLSLAAGAPLAAFVDPVEAIGGELLAMQPAGPQGRRWRQLFNEAQVILHHHPRNALRIGAGQPPVNALWFWGGGSRPERVDCAAASVLSADAELLALAKAAGIPAGSAMPGGLVDLRGVRDWTRVERVLEDAMREHASVTLDFADGARWRLERRQAWRFWRRRLSGVDA
jgi:hypothetical protein